MQNSDNYNLLKQYGWNDGFRDKFFPFGEQGLIPGRIIRDGRELYRAVTEGGELLLSPSGTFRYLMEMGTQPFPVVGDWVAIWEAGDGRGLIEAVLSRNTVLHRQGEDEEIGAANIDVTAVISGISEDFNLRRIERFLTNIHTSGASAALILTKADLVDDPEAYRRREWRERESCAGVTGGAGTQLPGGRSTGFLRGPWLSIRRECVVSA